MKLWTNDNLSPADILFFSVEEKQPTLWFPSLNLYYGNKKEPQADFLEGKGRIQSRTLRKKIFLYFLQYHLDAWESHTFHDKQYDMGYMTWRGICQSNVKECDIHCYVSFYCSSISVSLNLETKGLGGLRNQPEWSLWAKEHVGIQNQKNKQQGKN